MKLNENDKRFLESLSALMATNDLRVKLKLGQPGYIVLRGNYGEKIHKAFHMSRQGVRWRFQRIMDMYIGAFESVLTIERVLGSHIRQYAVDVSKQRYELRKRIVQNGFVGADKLAPRKKKERESGHG